jgi:hypothetical protein
MTTPMKRPVRLLAPQVPWPVLKQISLLAVAGALVAGGYGIVHDQLTYTLSPEYFTRMKFGQFAWADLHLTHRILVAEIGFLATWWAGFAGTWFFARLAASRRPAADLTGLTIRMWIIMLFGAVLGAAAGFGVGPSYYLRPGEWADVIESLGIEDTWAFAQVGGIHLGGYLGAFAGWVAAMFRVVAR